MFYILLGVRFVFANVNGMMWDEWNIDPKVLKDETLNIMLAGRDTTASTLTFIIYFLAMYPNVMDRLREEVLTKVYSRFSLSLSIFPMYGGIDCVVR